jgi:mono/diheme cytochrome c family protein
MRYYIALLFLLAVLVIGLAGFRGSISRRPPLEVFPDMDRQLKLRPQARSEFFADHRSSRLPVTNTIARGAPFEDKPWNTGRQPGTTNWVDWGPVTITAELLARGRERYQINCSPCHSPLADGNGITRKYGMSVVANLHEPRIIRMPDGELFNILSQGKGLMAGYADQIALGDRWAIIAYVRALQRSRLGAPGDVPAEARSILSRQP